MRLRGETNANTRHYESSRCASAARVGWTDEDIHDATQVIAYFNYINRIADALGVQVDEWVLEFEKN